MDITNIITEFEILLNGNGYDIVGKIRLSDEMYAYITQRETPSGRILYVLDVIGPMGIIGYILGDLKCVWSMLKSIDGNFPLPDYFIPIQLFLDDPNAYLET